MVENFQSLGTRPVSRMTLNSFIISVTYAGGRCVNRQYGMPVLPAAESILTFAIVCVHVVSSMGSFNDEYSGIWYGLGLYTGCQRSLIREISMVRCLN